MHPVQFYKCLGDETRLKCLLLISQFEQLCVCDLTLALALSQPKISRHLAELRKHGLLDDKRHGRWVYYRLHPRLPDWAKQNLQLALLHNADFIAGNISLLTAADSPTKRCC